MPKPWPRQMPPFTTAGPRTSMDATTPNQDLRRLTCVGGIRQPHGMAPCRGCSGPAPAAGWLASTRTPAPWSNHAAPRPAGPACRSSHAAVLTALMTAVEPHQPGYLSHSDAAAAPVDRLPQRQALIVSHRPQRFPARRSASRTRASRSPSAVSTATARASSLRSRSARSLRRAACASNAERRACLTEC